VDLQEALGLQEIAEELADTSLNAEDGLVGDGLEWESIQLSTN
jgi:hypothetical protein